jgi:hypothetical protein
LADPANAGIAIAVKSAANMMERHFLICFLRAARFVKDGDSSL